MCTVCRYVLLCMYMCVRKYIHIYVRMIKMRAYPSHWLALLSHHNLVASNLSVLHASPPYYEISSSPVVENAHYRTFS